MRKLLSPFIAALAVLVACSSSKPAPLAQAQTAPAAALSQPAKWGMVTHTGAGNFTLAGIAERKDAMFTHEGTNELDASIMDGSTMKAGAVAGLKHIKNPIRLARLVMEKSPHVMMAGEGAEAFAKEQGGIAFVDQKYFYTDRAWKALQDELAAEKNAAAAGQHHGTVGAVALDQHGNLAAGTSTHDICARVQYRNMPIQAAADAIVKDTLKPIGGEGGVIGLDARGSVTMSFNTTGMGRGYVGADGKPTIMFTADDGK